MSATPNDQSAKTTQNHADGNETHPITSKMRAVLWGWLRHYWDAPREKCKWTDIAMVLLTLAIAGAAFLSAWIFQGQLTETQKATALAELDFRRDERAWIGFKFSEGSMTFTFNKPFLVPTQLVNTGKTPARNVHGDIVVAILVRGEPLDFTYAKGRTAHYSVEAGTIFPGGGINESFEAIKHGQRRAEPIIFSPLLKKSLFSAESFLVVYGKIQYLDIFGVSHWTTYCRYVLHPEMISPQCVRYNDADNND